MKSPAIEPGFCFVERYPRCGYPCRYPRKRAVVGWLPDWLPEKAHFAGERVTPAVTAKPYPRKAASSWRWPAPRAKVLLGGSRPWGAQAREFTVFRRPLVVVYCPSASSRWTAPPSSAKPSPRRHGFGKSSYIRPYIVGKRKGLATIFIAANPCLYW